MQNPRSTLYRGLALLAAAALTIAPARAAEPPFPTPGGNRSALVQWLSANTSMRPETIIIVSPDAAFALVPGGDPPNAAGVTRRTLREEVLSPAFAATMRGRSSLQVLDFDCRQRRFKPVSITIYQGSDLQGAAERVAVSDEWADDMPGAYVAEYLKSVCDPTFKFPISAAPAAAATAAPASAPAGPALRPAQSVASPAAPPPPPARAQAAVQPLAPAAQVSAGAPAGAWVQIGAYRSAAEALAAISALAQGKGRASQVQQISTSGGVFFRALVGGFGATSEARSFCQALKASGRDCIVR